MACKIEEIQQTFEQMKFLPQPPIISEKEIEKYIFQMEGKKYMLRISPNCFIFSKQLF